MTDTEPDNDNDGDHEDKLMVCPICHEMCICTYGPDPYQSDVNNDDTPVWKCGLCRHESAMAI